MEQSPHSATQYKSACYVGSGSILGYQKLLHQHDWRSDTFHTSAQNKSFSICCLDHKVMRLQLTRRAVETLKFKVTTYCHSV